MMSIPHSPLRIPHFIALLLLLAAFPALAADWPMDRGNPQRTGVAAEPALTTAPQLLWKYKTDAPIEAGVAIAGGRVYGGSTGNQIFCLDLATGRPNWVTTVTGGIMTPPSVWEGRLFLAASGGDVICMDTQTTRTHWTFPTESEMHSSPVVVEGRLLVGSYDQNLHCLDPQTGKEHWKYEIGGPVHCSTGIGGDKALIAGCDQFLHAVWITSGSQAWSREMEMYSTASPAVLDGMVYVGHFGGKVLAVDLAKGEQKWEFVPPEGSDFPFYAGCAVTPELVIAAGRDKLVHALDRATGKRVWKFETKGEIDGAPVISGSTVWCPSKDGTLYALDLKTGRKVWEYVIGAPLAANPAVADGYLVVGDMEDTLYCFGSK